MTLNNFKIKYIRGNVSNGSLVNLRNTDEKLFEINETIILDFRSGYRGVIYLRNTTNSTVKLDGVYVNDGGRVTANVGGSFIFTENVVGLRNSKMDFQILNSSFNNIQDMTTGSYEEGGSIFVFNAYDNGQSKVLIENSFFCNNHTTRAAGNGGAVMRGNGMGLGIIRNSNFTNNEGGDAGAIWWRQSGDFISENNIYQNNHGDFFGGAITIQGEYDYGKLVRFENDKFYGNNAGRLVGSGNGGAITVMKSNGANSITKNVQIVGSEFVGNTTYAGDGGAVFLRVNDHSYIENSIFCNNYSKSSGGAIYLRGSGNLAINNTSFKDNSGGGNGGSLFYDGTGNYSITESVFHGNTSNNHGGAIYNNIAQSSQFTIDQSLFYRNSANKNGGAYYQDSRTHLSITNTEFSFNLAERGGAYYQSIITRAPEISFSTGTKFINNMASISGGAMFILNGGISIELGEIDGVSFWNNGANGSYTTAGDSDIRLENSLVWIGKVINSNLQFAPNTTNYPNYSSGNGFNLGAGNTHQTTPLEATIPNIVCPVVPAPFCANADDIVKPTAAVIVNDVAPTNFNSICGGSPAEVKFVSNTGVAPFTFSYRKITKQYGVETNMETGLLINSDATGIASFFTDAELEGTEIIYEIESIVDARGVEEVYIHGSGKVCSTAPSGRIFWIDCVDSDGDGIIDIDDLDDDNDGILDVDECDLFAINVLKSKLSNFTEITPDMLNLADGYHATATQDISEFFGYDAGTEAVIVTVSHAYVNAGKFVQKEGYDPTFWSLSGSISSFASIEHSKTYQGNDWKGIRILDGRSMVAHDTNVANSPSVWLNVSNAYDYMLFNMTTAGGNGDFSFINPNSGNKYFEIYSHVDLEESYTIKILPECDDDMDGIPNRLDLDSDGDGCEDAIEGQAAVGVDPIEQSDLVVASSVLSSQTPNKNLGNDVDANGVPLRVQDGQGVGDSQDDTVQSENCDASCVKPGAVGTPTLSKVGITTQGSTPSIEGWPEVVPNGYLVLDAAEKGFVITHMTTAQRDAMTSPVVGMMIYNTDEDCVQIYRGLTPGIDSDRKGWNCLERGCNE